MGRAAARQLSTTDGTAPLKQILRRKSTVAGKREHAAWGAIAGFSAYAVIKTLRKEEWTLGGALASAAAGAGVACLPDVLEPAHHPNHRGFFHSVATLAGIGCINKAVWESPTVSPDVKIAVTVVSVGYASHPVKDSTTTKGIPFIGR